MRYSIDFERGHGVVLLYIRRFEFTCTFVLELTVWLNYPSVSQWYFTKTKTLFPASSDIASSIAVEPIMRDRLMNFQLGIWHNRSR
jgi:hypothetical protein